MSFLWGNTAQQQQDPKKFANISNDQINSNQQAQPVKYLAGRNYVAGDFITPAYNPKAVPVKTQSGKGQSTTTGYKYFADFALVFCMGGRHPVDGIRTVIVDSDIRWTGTVNRIAGQNFTTITVQDLGTFHLYWGTETQGIDATLLTPRNASASNHQDKTTFNANHTAGTEQFGGLDAGDSDPYSGHYDRHPAYRGQCYAVFKDWKLGRDRTSVPNIQLELMRGCPWIGGGQVSASDAGVNPAAVLYDWLTDTRFGMALPESMLNTTTFTTLYNQLAAKGALISPMISQQSDFRQQVAELLEYYDGWIRRNGTKIEVGMWQSGNLSSPIHLIDDDLLGEPELEPQGWGPTFNELTVVYKDREHHFNDYTQVYRDPNNFRITGGPRPETFNRPWITDADLAKQYARTAGAAMALPFTKGDLTVKREWIEVNAIQPGMIFNFDSGFYGLSFLLRLLEVEQAADNSAKAVMTVEWERSKWPNLYVPPGLQGPGGFVLGPRAIWQSSITEVPYLLLDDKFDTQIVPHAVKGNVEVQGYRIWVSLDGGSTYNNIPTSGSNSSFSYFGRVGAAIPLNGTAMWVTLFGVGHDEIVSQTLPQQRDDNLLAFIEGEVLSVGAINTYAKGVRLMQILRGRFATPHTAHALNTKIFFIYRSDLKLLDNAGFTPGATVLFKLQPFTADLDYDLTSVTPITYNVIGWATIAAPTCSPSPGTFNTAADITLAEPPAGFVARFTRNGTPVTGSSPEWPGAPPPYSVLHITATTTLRIRYYSPNGRFSGEFQGTWTKVIGTIPQPQCGTPSWSFSGTPKHTGGNLTLTNTTSGATIKYQKNGGAIQTYSSPIAIVCNIAFDVVEFWAEMAGKDPSPHYTFDNTKEETGGGGGHWPPRNPV